MLSTAAERPAGRLSEVYSGRELDAAYDFVEGAGVQIHDLEAAVGRAAVRELAGRCVRVAVDGSSLMLARHGNGHTKGFGALGTVQNKALGLKVISALAMDGDGVPAGVVAQTWWARPTTERRRTAQQKKREGKHKQPREKETARWLETIERAAARLQEVGARGWFQLDREGDAWSMLCSLASTGHRFTVRSAHDRLLAGVGDRQYLRARLLSQAPLGFYEVDVVDRAGRPSRRARMCVRAVRLTLMLRESMHGKKPRPFVVNVVSAREEGTTPPTGGALDWMLLTNAPIDALADAKQVITGYTMRWRIEEFHRTWKTGGCDVESTQLRSRDAVIRWATILGVIAARVERIKRLSREEPDRPATDEFSAVELRVLIALKRRIKKRAEQIPDDTPSMAQAAMWLADLGGYTGKSSGGPPGAITIGRGLERLLHGVEAVLAMSRA